MITIVNITTFTDCDSAAEHYYAAELTIESSSTVHEYINTHQNFREMFYVEHSNELTYQIDKKEADKLNRKDRTPNLYKEGEDSYRFYSIEHAKQQAIRQFPDNDIIFLIEFELKSDEDVIQMNKEKQFFTGQQIRIGTFNGFSRNFENMTPNSIHKVIKQPKKYDNKELRKGVWVMGIYDPILVLEDEYTLLK